jgi:hypothetical protein
MIMYDVEQSILPYNCRSFDQKNRHLSYRLLLFRSNWCMEKPFNDKLTIFLDKL